MAYKLTKIIGTCYKSDVRLYMSSINNCPEGHICQKNLNDIMIEDNKFSWTSSDKKNFVSGKWEGILSNGHFCAWKEGNCSGDGHILLEGLFVSHEY